MEITRSHFLVIPFKSIYMFLHIKEIELNKKNLKISIKYPNIFYMSILQFTLFDEPEITIL
jgi:branched-subunit amino acid transport protein AzlD